MQLYVQAPFWRQMFQNPSLCSSTVSMHICSNVISTILHEQIKFFLSLTFCTQRFVLVRNGNFLDCFGWLLLRSRYLVFCSFHFGRTAKYHSVCLDFAVQLGSCKFWTNSVRFSLGSNSSRYGLNSVG